MFWINVLFSLTDKDGQLVGETISIGGPVADLNLDLNEDNFSKDEVVLGYRVSLEAHKGMGPKRPTVVIRPNWVNHEQGAGWWVHYAPTGNNGGAVFNGFYSDDRDGFVPIPDYLLNAYVQKVLSGKFPTEESQSLLVRRIGAESRRGPAGSGLGCI
jgi:hypothetical protein